MDKKGTLMKMLSRFFLLLRPHYKQGLGISLLLLISSLITVGTPFVYRQLVDNGIMKGNISHLIKMLVIILISLVIQELLFLGQKALNLNIRKNVFSKLRMDLYTHLLRLPQSFYSDHHKGRLLSRITSDVDAVQNLLLEKYIYFVQSLLIGLFIFIIFLSISWKMIFVASVFLPILYFLYLIFKNNIFLLSKKVQEKQENLMERLQEDLSMVKAIQSYSVLDERMNKTFKVMQESEDAKKKLSMKYSAASSSTIIINMIGLIVIWGIGGVEVTKGRMSIGTLIAISFFLHYIVNLFFNAYYAVMGFQTSLPAAQRIFEILDFSPAITNRPDAIDMNESLTSIEFKNITFAYPRNKPVFTRGSFRLNKGDLVGIVGRSGQGKTTLANLIMRFYDPDDGIIEINGMDIRRIKIECLRRDIAIVPQEDYLFNISIRDNVVMGRKDISEELFVKACESASVHNFAASFGDGYDTIIGENGVLLSSGQRKRISIARALLDNPHVLIFDEATAVLDEINEKEILESIEKLANNRIVMVITHKISNIQASNKVIQINEGVIDLYNGFEEYCRIPVEKH
jgi:ATP-binding cassette, subfamily B, bacterial MsbA